MKRQMLISLLIGTAASPALAQVRRYVYFGAGGTNDGTSWNDAYTELSSALDDAWLNAPALYEIWVAKGTYFPSDRSDALDVRSARFVLLDNATILGGFDRDETDESDRDPDANETILSGNIGDDDDLTDNVYHVVEANGTSLLATLDGFTITGGYADGGGTHDDGGGIYIPSGDATIADCLIVDNYAERDGGGIYATGGGAPEFMDCTITENAAGSDGGGVYCKQSNLRLKGCLISSNHAVLHGGGLRSEQASPQLGRSGVTDEPTQVVDNHADGNGGGMYGSGPGGPELTDGCLFEENRAAGNGGALYNEGVTITLTDCEIHDNHADADGGAMYNVSLGGASEISDNLFEGNKAGANGGAVANDDSGFYVMTRCDFINNLAGDRGGAAYVIDGSDATHHECRFLTNTAGVGGAVSIQNIGGTSGTASFFDCLFARNEATAGNGGAVQTFDSRVTLAGCTIVANKAMEAFGGGVFARIPMDGTNLPSLSNSIVYYNSDSEGVAMNAQVRLVGITVDELIDDERIVASCIRGISAVEGNIASDPGFVDADGTDGDHWRLGAHSPCIDAGMGSPSGSDIEGLTRSVDDPVVENTGPSEGYVDMGAYEYQYDCNSNGVVDSADLADGLSSDCADNGVPDECEDDSDGDGLIDSCDGCPDDDEKTAPGVCGCNSPEDENTNGIPDCQEEDPVDPADDVDGDGAPNASDNCPQTANASQSDRDEDGTGDACDGCPDDGDKTTQGVCGCGIPDTDTDEDGVIDCNDNCPEDANSSQADSDGDGPGDACDGCPDDSEKTEPGVCGCGERDFDSDLDGVLNCLDQCAMTPPGTQVGSNGCPPGSGPPPVQPPDSDSDGVTDDADDCPDTPAGQTVDNVGCPVAAPSPTPEPTATTTCGAIGMAAPLMLLMGMVPMAVRPRRRTRRET